MLKKSNHPNLISNFTQPHQWFRNFLLTSLCAAAVACPANDLGAADAIGAYAVLKKDLHIVDGYTQEAWSNVGANTTVQNYNIKGANDGSTATMLDGSTQYSLSINGGTFASVWGGFANTVGTATASNNIVIIYDGIFGGMVQGAYGQNVGSGADTVSYNTVTIYGGTFKHEVRGGFANASDGSDTASYNTVTISGGTFKGRVFGGYAQYTSTGAVTLSNNTVTISGGTFNDSVWGAYLQYNGRGKPTISDNTVIIERGADGNNPNLTNATLYGSNMKNGTGNTLKLYTRGLTAKNVENFQNYTFVVSNKTIAESGNPEPALTLTATSTNLSNATVTIAVKKGIVLKAAQSGILIQNNGTINTKYKLIIDNCKKGIIPFLN